VKLIALRALFFAVALSVLVTGAHAGNIEICKVSDPPDSLSSLFYYFTISGQPGLGQIPVFVDACTDPIALPDGQYTITEVPDPTSTLESISAFPDFALLSVDLPDDSATVLAEGGTDLTQEVTLSFVNTPAVNAPEPGTAWLLGLGLAIWALNPRKHPYSTAFQNATSPVERMRSRNGRGNRL